MSYKISTLDAASALLFFLLWCLADSRSLLDGSVGNLQVLPILALVLAMSLPMTSKIGARNKFPKISFLFFVVGFLGGLLTRIIGSFILSAELELYLSVFDGVIFSLTFTCLRLLRESYKDFEDRISSLIASRNELALIVRQFESSLSRARISFQDKLTPEIDKLASYSSSRGFTGVSFVELALRGYEANLLPIAKLLAESNQIEPGSPFQFVRSEIARQRVRLGDFFWPTRVLIFTLPLFILGGTTILGFSSANQILALWIGSIAIQWPMSMIAGKFQVDLRSASWVIALSLTGSWLALAILISFTGQTSALFWSLVLASAVGGILVNLGVSALLYQIRVAIPVVENLNIETESLVSSASRLSRELWVLEKRISLFIHGTLQSRLRSLELLQDKGALTETLIAESMRHLEDEWRAVQKPLSAKIEFQKLENIPKLWAEICTVTFTGLELVSASGFNSEELFMLREALSELVANATKHSSSKYVEISFEKVEAGLQVTSRNEGQIKPTQAGLGMKYLNEFMSDLEISQVRNEVQVRGLFKSQLR